MGTDRGWGSRRRFLRAGGFGTLVWLGGCSRLPFVRDSHHEVGEQVSLETGSVAVTAVTLRYEVVTFSEMGDHRVRRNPSGQWLLVAVEDTTTVDAAAERSRFELEYAGRRAGPIAEEPELVPSREGPSWDLALPIPAIELERAAVVWADGDRTVRWAVPSAVLEHATSLPEFVVRDYSVQGMVERGESPTVSFTVKNRGDRSGWARAILQARTQTGEVAGFRGTAVELGWDESRTHEDSIPVDYEVVDDRFEAELRTGAGSMSQRVRVADGSESPS